MHKQLLHACDTIDGNRKKAGDHARRPTPVCGAVRVPSHALYHV